MFGEAHDTSEMLSSVMRAHPTLFSLHATDDIPRHQASHKHALRQDQSAHRQVRLGTRATWRVRLGLGRVELACRTLNTTLGVHLREPSTASPRMNPGSPSQPLDGALTPSSERQKPPQLGRVRRCCQHGAIASASISAHPPRFQ